MKARARAHLIGNWLEMLAKWQVFWDLAEAAQGYPKEGAWKGGANACSGRWKRAILWWRRSVAGGVPTSPGLRRPRRAGDRECCGGVKGPTAGYVKREGQFLTVVEIDALAQTCRGECADVVWALALGGLRWAELAGLQVGDRVRVPGEGLRLQRTVMSSRDKGALFENTLKNKRSRTVPLVPDLVAIIDTWCAGKGVGEWMFSAPKGGPLGEPNWKRSVAWKAAIEKIGRPRLRVHDPRHTCASLWLGAGADPKVVQRILGHASAAMTMDLCGHLIDDNLWTSTTQVGGIVGASASNRGGGELGHPRRNPA